MRVGCNPRTVRPRGPLWAAALAAIVALVGPGAAQAAAPTLPETPIPVHVVFTGTGRFHYDNSVGSHAVADDQLDWDVDYQAELQPDGSLTATSGLPPATAGTYTFTDDFYGVACSGPISTVPQSGPPEPGDPNPPPETTPSPQTDGLLVQSITYLSNDPAKFSDCVGSLDGFDGSGEAADGVSTVLSTYLPGALTARIPAVPRPAFLAGGVALRILPVSNADAPTQIPPSCADMFGIEDPSQCSISLSWNGTVTLDATAGCPIILATPTPVCMPSSGTPLSDLTQGVETDATGPGTASVTVTAAAVARSHMAGAHAPARQIVIATAATKVTRAGRVRLRPRITPAGRRLIERTRRMKVTVQVTFRPRSGHARTTRWQTVLVTAGPR
ncbi:MAG: hypothetical protein ACXVSE_15780 [Solirubrobacteraceae bacterium]